MWNEVLEWLQTSKAASGAQRELSGVGLPPTLVDDVLQETALRLWHTQIEAEGVPDNAAAYAYRAMQNVVRDLHRRRKRRVKEILFDEFPPSLDFEAWDVEVPSQLEDACRRAAHGSIARSPWGGAAVLNELTFHLHSDVPIPDGAPAPQQSAEDQRIRWASLWLAGKVDCFPDREDLEDAAMRQRRSRALARVDQLLRQALEIAQAGAQR